MTNTTDPASSTTLGTPPAPSSRGTLLLVDDEPDIRFVGRRALARAGYQGDVFADGASAIAAVRRAPERYDAIVLDLSMPGMSGDRVLAEIRATRPDLPTLLSSGWAATDVRVAFAGQTADGVLPKPYRPDELVRAVGRLRGARTAA